MSKISKAKKLEIEKACVMTLKDSPPDWMERLDRSYFKDLRAVNSLVAGRWAKLIAPYDVTVEQIDDEFFEQYIDREARWHRALFELIMAAESSMKRECNRREIVYPFGGPKELYNYLIDKDAEKKLTTEENLQDSLQISRLIKKCYESDDQKKKRFYLDRIKDMRKNGRQGFEPSSNQRSHQYSFWFYLLFNVSSRKSSRGTIKDRWQDFLLASMRVVESIDIYANRKTKQKQVKI